MSTNNGTLVIAPIVPWDSLDIYPTHIDTYGKGGYRSVSDASARNNIPLDRRSEGMLVRTLSDGKLWQLTSDLTSWVEQSLIGTLPGQSVTISDPAGYFSGNTVEEIINEIGSKLISFANKSIFNSALPTLANGDYSVRSDESIQDSTGVSLPTQYNVVNGVATLDKQELYQYIKGRTSIGYVTALAGYYQIGDPVLSSDRLSIWTSSTFNNSTNPDTGGLGWISSVIDKAQIYLASFRNIANHTDRINAAISAANAIYSVSGNITTLFFPPLEEYTIDICTLKSGINIEGRRAIIKPTSDTTGRFVGEDIFDFTMTELVFEQTANVNYMPTCYILRGSNISFYRNRYVGCGAGVRTLLANDVVYRENSFRQVGVYPRPVGSGSDFSAAYLRYGFGLKSDSGDNILFDNNKFINDELASGNPSDITGGAGAFSTYLSNKVRFEGGVAVNAPGQGFMAIGEWEENDIPALIAAGTMDYNKRGTFICFNSCQASGCNQEGITAFGCGQVTFTGLVTVDNLMSNAEVWSCWNVAINGLTIQDMQRRNAGTLSAMNIVKSYNVTGNSIVLNRLKRGGIRIGGSKIVTLNAIQILEYAISDEAASDGFTDSAISITEASGTANSTEISIFGSTFQRTSQINNSGQDIFCNSNTIVLNEDGNHAVGRAVSYNSGALNSKTRSAFYSKDNSPLLWGNTARRPIGGFRGNRVVSVTSTPTPILSLNNLTSAMSGLDSFLVLVNGSNDGDLTNAWTDVVLVLNGAVPITLGTRVVTGSTPATANRVYTTSGGFLQLAMEFGTYSVRAAALHTGNGNIANA